MRMNKEFTEFVSNNPDGLDYDTVRSLYMCAPFQIKYDETMKRLSMLEECHQSWMHVRMIATLPGYLTMTTEESKERHRSSKLTTPMKWYTALFWRGRSGTGWDGFVAQLKDLGSERGEEINADAYARYEARE